MLSLQSDPRLQQYHHNQLFQQQQQQVQLFPYNHDSSSLNSDFGGAVAAPAPASSSSSAAAAALSNVKLSDPNEADELWGFWLIIVVGGFVPYKVALLLVDDNTLMALAHQNYKAGNYKQALEHSSVVYERNPCRTDNLLLLGAIHYQLHDYDQCIAKNEEALRIDPHFAECYGNMANAWKEKGNIDTAIQYYLFAIE
ncbi:hypothetical protein Goari_002840, partial [Gossypium aridum]|nr:hypothetical protein [Gossypium aridum]